MDEINTEESNLDNEQQREAPANNKKKYIIYVAAIFAILLCLLGVWFYFFKYSSKSNSSSTNELSSNQAKNSSAPVFYNLDEFIVNLNKVNNQTNFLKISLTFQLQANEDVAKIEEKLPLIKDIFQIYLRELKPEEIQGSAGIFLLKQELLLRVNKVLYPIKILDVLFRDLLVQ